MEQKLLNKLLASLSDVGAFVTESVANKKVFEHQVFCVSKRLTYTSLGVLNIGIDTTDLSDLFVVLLPFTIKGYDAGPLNIDVYINSTFSDGTEWVGVDRNMDTPSSPVVKWYFNPTITDIGEQLPVEFFVPSDGTPASVKIAGESSNDLPMNLKLDTKCVIRITNSTSTAGVGSFSANWFELPT